MELIRFEIRFLSLYYQYRLTHTNTSALAKDNERTGIKENKLKNNSK